MEIAKSRLYPAYVTSGQFLAIKKTALSTMHVYLV